MTTPQKLRANQENSRASTGPRSTAGKSRSARNARRHGLAIPIRSVGQLAPEIEALADCVAGSGTSAKRFELSRAFAEAQIDLVRVRQARHELLTRALSDPDYVLPEDATKKAKRKSCRASSELRQQRPERPGQNRASHNRPCTGNGRHGPVRAPSSVAAQGCDAGVGRGARTIARVRPYGADPSLSCAGFRAACIVHTTGSPKSVAALQGAIGIARCAACSILS